MAEPIPQAETADDALRRASAGLDALKRAKPATPAEERRRAAELVHAQQTLQDAARRVTDAAVARKFTNGDAKTGGLYGLTERQVEGVIKAMAACLAPHFKAFDERFAALEARPETKALTNDGEARQPLFDGGTWNVTKVFQPGDVVTYIGTLWVCREQNVDTRPGKSDAWRLMEKSHR